MNKLLHASVLLIALIGFVSCNNEPVYKTDLDKIEAELKGAVKDNNITKCTIYINQSDLSPKVIYSEVDFSISNGFIIITGYNDDSGKYEVRYNLLYLSNYTISGGQLYLNFNLAVQNITDIDKIEAELKNIVEENNVTKCTIYVYQSDFSQRVIYSNMDFSISNGFIVLTGYNLNAEKYEIRYSLLYLADFSVRSGQLYINFTNIIM